MKHVFSLVAAMSLCSLSAHAADITAAEAMSAEVAHEQQVQIQMEHLQRERDAAFLKQLEAEALIDEQLFLAEEASLTAETQP